MWEKHLTIYIYIHTNNKFTSLFFQTLSLIYLICIIFRRPFKITPKIWYWVSSVICLKYCRYGVKHYPINQLNLQLIPFSKFQKIVQVLVSRQCDSWTCYAIWLKSAVQYTLPLHVWTSETTPLEVTSGWTFNKPIKFTLGKLASGLVPDY